MMRMNGNQVYRHYGQRIKELRVDRGWSQLQFADRIGLRRENVCHYERATKRPGALVITRIARRLLLDIGQELSIGGFDE